MGVGKPKNMKDYALYRGDNICMVGKLDEVANYIGCSRKLIHNYKAPSYQKKYELYENRYVVYEIKG